MRGYFKFIIIFIVFLLIFITFYISYFLIFDNNDLEIETIDRSNLIHCNEYLNESECVNFDIRVAKESVKFWREDNKTCLDIIGKTSEGCEVFLENCSCFWDVKLNKCRTKVNISVKNCIENISISNIGMCSYGLEGIINCTKEAFFFSILYGNWTWNPENSKNNCSFIIGKDCFIKENNSYFDPFFNYNSCVSPLVVSYSSGLPFFSFYHFLITLFIIMIIYFLLIKKTYKN
jgi:hypothetical protein